MKKVLSILLISLAMGSLQAQELPLSPTATASVITCGPGDEFYLTFGHSAIRITDTAKGIDYAYNYGTFDFDIPHFYWHFVRGRLDYCLSRTGWNRFMFTYEAERRAVWEQRLDLSPQEVSNLYTMLEWNYLPENRYYRYDFFRDNCATRVRDMVDGACGKLPVEYPNHPRRSYRRYVHDAAGDSLQWWILGVDLLLGLPADHPCTAAEAAFYPMVMHNLYGSALRGQVPLLAGEKQLLYDCRDRVPRSFPPVVVFGLLFAVVALLSWRCRSLLWFDRILFVLAGLVGLFLVFMWAGTDHYCTAWNLNILWASPLLILIAIRMHRSPSWALWFQMACFFLAALWVVVCGVSLGLLPIILMLALRVACLIPKTQQRQRRLR